MELVVMLSEPSFEQASYENTISRISIKGKQAIASFLASVIFSTGFMAVIFKQIYSRLKTNAKAIN